MPEPRENNKLLTKKALENYASSYLGAYLNAVEREKPEHVPPLARNHPYAIEVCLMPNHCFTMLFERADRQNITVRECDWAYVEKKALAGTYHMVVVYAHENPTVADAISRGKKDAVRNIRSLEDSNLAKAVNQLERILTDLTSVEKGNKSLLKLAELELTKLEPIKDVVSNSGPEIDMLAMIDTLRNYPTKPVEVSIDIKERELLENISRDLGDLSDVVRRVESQDEALERIEASMNKALGEFNCMIDERINQGLAVLVSNSDGRAGRCIAAAEPPSIQMDIDPEVAVLKDRMQILESSLHTAQSRRADVSKELVMAVADIRDNIEQLSTRISRLEQKAGIPVPGYSWKPPEDE
jgi:hypothetical protein